MQIFTHRALLATLFLVAALAAPAQAQDDYGARALDLVYEAADALDQARSEFEAGREGEAERLLARAEDFLDRAERMEPSLPRIAVERARLYRLDRQPAQAEATLLKSMRGDLDIVDHVKAVELLDRVRGDLGKPRVGLEWHKDQELRDAGIGILAGGLGASLAGFVIAFASFNEEVHNGITDAGVALNAFGWTLSTVGGGVAVTGGIVTAAGQSRLVKLRDVLPGPWRLPGATSGSSGRDLRMSFRLTFTIPPRKRPT